MPRKIKDENGNEIEVFSQEELEASQKEAQANALKPLREKFNLGDEDDIVDGISKFKTKEDDDDIRNLRQGKEKTRQQAREEVIAEFKSKGIDVEVDANGKVEVKNRGGMSAEDVAAMLDARDGKNRYNSEKATLLANLDPTKKADVEKWMDGLSVEGATTEQLFNMSIAALGVDVPNNINNNPMNGYPNRMPIDSGNQTNKGVDTADTQKGYNIMKDFGMSPELINKARELGDRPRLFSEGRITPGGDAIGSNYIANQHDKIS